MVEESMNRGSRPTWLGSRPFIASNAPLVGFGAKLMLTMIGPVVPFPLMPKSKFSLVV